MISDALLISDKVCQSDYAPTPLTVVGANKEGRDSVCSVV